MIQQPANCRLKSLRMLSKCSSRSILAVHFEKQLLSSHSFPPPFLLSYLTTTTSSTQTHDPIRTQSFFSTALRQSAKTSSLIEGKRIHSAAIKLGYTNLLSIQNQLIHHFIKCKEFIDAGKVFDEMRVRNVVTWNTVISGAVSSSEDTFQWGFSYFRKMMGENVGPDEITFNALICACIEVIDRVETGKALHCMVMKLGFVLSCFVGSAVVNLYGKVGLVEDARRAFDDVMFKDLVLWNVMVSCYSVNDSEGRAFLVFYLMRYEGFNGDAFTFSSLLSGSANAGLLETRKQIHGIIIRLSYDSDTLVATGLVDMYAKNGNIDDARKAFDEMTARNVVSWTTMIVGYGKNGNGKEAMRLLKYMFRKDFVPDELTLASVFSSCGHSSSSAEIMLVHAYVIKSGFHAFLSILNALINAYSRCGAIADAVRVFSLTNEPNIVTWTSLINAYGFHGLPRKSIETFEVMISRGVRPDQIAFLGVLSACSHAGLVDLGLYYFNLMTNHYGVWPNSEHYTCLVDLLGRAGFLKEAYHVLSSQAFKQGPHALAAFIWACKVHGNTGLGLQTTEKLLLLEPNKPVNYTLMSNTYATMGSWLDVASIRDLMGDWCDRKVPGCSWMEIAGEFHSFTSGDQSHPHGAAVYAMLEFLIFFMKEENAKPNELNTN